MNGFLVRVGIDGSYGNWNGPARAYGRFVYVPIPESSERQPREGLLRSIYYKHWKAGSRWLVTVCNRPSNDIIQLRGYHDVTSLNGGDED